MITVGGRDFVPFKCAGAYLGGYSETWLKVSFPRLGGPKRVRISPKKTGWWKRDLDIWLRRRTGKRAA